MEARLIKDKYSDDFYYLKIGINTYATTGKESFRVLSLKNCQAIELGYDLDELADEFSRKFPNDSEPIRYASFIIGFQKALSILGDKKFSERDVKIAYNRGSYDDRLNNKKLFSDDKYIKSLQQTEWEVIVEMEDIIHLKNRRGGLTNMGKPKLDADGCLILKRK